MADHRIADRPDGPHALLSRRDLLQRADAGGIVGLSGTWPAIAFAAQATPGGRAAADPPSLSRQFARWRHDHDLHQGREELHEAGTGREFMWDFNEEVRRIREVIPGLPIPGPQFEEIIAACRARYPGPRRQPRAAHAEAVIPDFFSRRPVRDSGCACGRRC